MTEEERNLETVKRWMHFYNSDVKRMIQECYAENAEVHDMGYLVMKDHHLHGSSQTPDRLSLSAAKEGREKTGSVT